MQFTGEKIMHKATVIRWLIILAMSSCLVAQERFVLAAENDWYPYSAERGKTAEGRTVDIVKAAYAAAGVELSLNVVPFNRGMILTKSGQYAGVFNAGLNDEVRGKYLIPRNPVALSEQVVVARTGEPFKGVESFNGKRLTLTLGYTYQVNVTGDRRNAIEYAPADLSNLKKIAVRRADFTIIDRFVLQSILKAEPALRQQLAVVGVLSSENIYVVFAMNEQGTRARDAFDKGMETIKGNGVLKSIYDGWNNKLK